MSFWPSNAVRYTFVARFVVSFDACFYTMYVHLVPLAVFLVVSWHAHCTPMIIGLASIRGNPNGYWGAPRTTADHLFTHFLDSSGLILDASGNFFILGWASCKQRFNRGCPARFVIASWQSVAWTCCIWRSFISSQAAEVTHPQLFRIWRSLMLMQASGE